MNMNEQLAALRAAYQQDMNPSLAVRHDRLDRLLAMVEKYWDEWPKCIGRDFGHRAHQETMLGDVLSAVATVRHARRKVRAWMRPQKVATGWMYRPGYNRVLRQPLGVVGIVSPWNYPLYLALAPLAQALAAGNRAMLKPSEITPRFSALLQRAVGEFFRADEVLVVTGDADVGRAFTQLPFDHLLFTGSTPVGRHVAVAAAQQLTPVTLELGGKSPAIIDASADLARHVPRIAYTKLFSAGQTCVAPDYVWLPRGQEAAFEKVFRDTVGKLFPSVLDNPDYSCIVNERHYQRIMGLLQDAEAKGARVVRIHPVQETFTDAARKCPPTLVFNVTDDMAVMNEEIFGPVLPVRSYESPQEIYDYLKDRDRPLALYWFGSNNARRDDVLANTISGGVCINDCMRQVSQDDAPFGGVGASGMGAYHGERGFLAFSQERSVYHRSNLSPLMALAPPYKANFAQVVKWVSRWI